LARLAQKGLVSHIVKDKTRHFQAAEPSRIRGYLEKKERDFKKQREEIEKILPQLEKQQKTARKIRAAQIFEGFRGIQTVHEHTYLKLKRGEEYFYLGVPAFQEEKYHLYWQRDHKRRERAGIKCRLLFNQGTDREILENRNRFRGCDARYMPVGIETPAWIMGYKDVTIIGLQSKKGMAIEIINEEIADSFRKYFETFWKSSRPFRKARSREA
jgi:hypothetical protein